MSGKPALAARQMDGIPFAGIRKVLEKANRLAAAGIDVIHFEIGRPDFDTPAHIKEAAKAALDKGLVHYAPNSGLPGLCAALAADIAGRKGIVYDPATELIVTAGGQEALYLALRALLDPGDEVLVPDPGFGTFSSQVRLAGGIPVAVPLVPGNNYQFDLQFASKAVGPRTKALIVNSPHNPTGAVLTAEQLKEIACFVLDHQLVLLSDEAYDRMLYDGALHRSAAALPGMRERTLVCGSLSKTYAMTGWRVGYLAAPAELVAAAVKVQQNVMLSVCTFAQAGAIAALSGSQDCVAAMMAEFSRRRRVMTGIMAQIPGLSQVPVPRGAFYVFARHTLGDLSSARLADYLLDEAGVAVVDGTSFGSQGEGYLRFSYAASYAHCQEGMERVAGAMEKLTNDRAILG